MPHIRHSCPTLYAGDVSTRTAYRWLRRLPRNVCITDVYVFIEWPGDLDDDTARALRKFDLPCKTIEDTQGRWGVRTRAWQGSQSQCNKIRWMDGPHKDRPLGIEYARVLSRLLRTAWRSGIPMVARRMI